MKKRLPLLLITLLSGCAITDPLTTTQPFIEYGAKTNSIDEETKAIVTGGLDLGRNRFGRLQLSASIDHTGESEWKLVNRVEF